MESTTHQPHEKSQRDDITLKDGYNPSTLYPDQPKKITSPLEKDEVIRKVKNECSNPKLY